MNKQRSRSWIWQIVLFLGLSILFSALPLGFALLLDKSSVPLTIITAWYAAFPPVILLILAWLLYHHETSWAAIAGRLAASVGVWFGLQALLAALIDLPILVRLFALPATLSGDRGFLGAVVFLIGGLALWIGGLRLGLNRPSAPGGSINVVGFLLRESPPTPRLPQASPAACHKADRRPFQSQEGRHNKPRHLILPPCSPCCRRSSRAAGTFLASPPTSRSRPPPSWGRTRSSVSAT